MFFLQNCTRFKLQAFTLVAILLVTAWGSASANTNHSAAGSPQMQTPAPTGTVVVKMAIGSQTGLKTVSEELTKNLSNLLSEIKVQPRFTNLSKHSTNHNLGRYFQFETRNLSQKQLLKIVGTLNANPSVEVAFLEPVAVPAALGFDAFTGDVHEIEPTRLNQKSTTTTPDFESEQGYLTAAPLGIGAIPMRAQAGALGAGVSVIDVEGGWLWTHEDLPAPLADIGIHVDALSWRNHGTAVMGEIRGQDNGIGVTGITPACAVGSSSIGATSTANALAAAVDTLNSGDLILIELHAPGPNANGNGQFGYVPMEYWPDNFDIIRLATEKGIIVCEAAGNGYQNLDDAVYQGLFDRTNRDSGAIMCGATAGSELYSADFSNNGTRVDINGWGWYVATTGYGDLQGGEETEFYTSQFSGTSSASPIVTGSVGSLQGMVRASLGFDLDARMARDILRETGTPMESGHLIGTRPNLVAAFAHADTIVGEISGTVISLEDSQPVEGVVVQVEGNGSFTVTDENGQWRIPLAQGPVSITFSSYYFHTLSGQAATIIAGATTTLNATLDPLNLINITGTLYSDYGAVANAVITATNQPVSGSTTAGDGSFTLSSYPAKYQYDLLFDGVSGYGARFESVATEGLTADVNISPIMPLVTENFGTDDGGFVSADGLWTHGTPPAAVTGPAFDSTQCWGIGMDGDYDDEDFDTLTSPVYNLSGIVGDDYYLSFHYFSATEGGFDGVNLSVNMGESYMLLTPAEGYADPSLGGLENNPGWSGQSGRWQGTVFNIGPYTNENFQFRFAFGADSGVFEQGFYIDGIAFGMGLSASAVSNDSPPVTQVPTLKAWPNPFNPQVTLNYSISQPGNLQVDVFDVRGNRVRTLLRAPVAQTQGRLRWDGRSDEGRLLASGVYFVRLIGPDNQKTSQRVVLAK